jgi:hypothetical protein
MGESQIQLERLGTNVWLILKRILKEYDPTTSTGFIWLWAGNSDGSSDVYFEGINI